MTTRKSIFLLTALTILSFAACKKQYTFKYKATCIDCKISYYDESGNFVSRENYQGGFEKEITVSEFSPAMIAVQSSAFPDSAANNPIFLTDMVMVELLRDGEIVCSDTSANGKKLQAVSCEYNWQN